MGYLAVFTFSLKFILQIFTAQQAPRAVTVAHDVIWQGHLEWNEKKGMAGTSNGVHVIPCKIATTSMNANIKTDGWPSTLQMLLVQKSLLSSVGNTYFQNIHKVTAFIHGLHFVAKFKFNRAAHDF